MCVFACLHLVGTQCQHLSTCVIFQRDTLPADPADAPRGPAGRNVASPRLCRLYPSAGTQSQQGFWLLLVSWRLSVWGFIAFPRHVLFFTTTWCRVQSLHMGMRISKMNIQQSQKKRATVHYLMTISSSARETVAPLEYHSAERQRWLWLHPVATSIVFKVCVKTERWRRAECQGCCSSSTAWWASLYWLWLMTILLLAETGHQRAIDLSFKERQCRSIGILGPFPIQIPIS